MKSHKRTLYFAGTKGGGMPEKILCYKLYKTIEEISIIVLD